MQYPLSQRNLAGISHVMFPDHKTIVTVRQCYLIPAKITILSQHEFPGFKL